MYYKVREVNSIKELLYSSVEIHGDKEAFLVKKKKGGAYYPISYSRLRHDVDSLGTYLKHMGLSGQKIAIIGENCYPWIVSYLAIVNGVGVVVPLDKELTKQEIYNLIETAGCRGVFYTSTFEKYFEDYDIDFKVKMWVYEEEEGFLLKKVHGLKKHYNIWDRLVRDGSNLIKEGDRSYIDAPVNIDEMSILLFTSGTTGKAKGVMLSHRAIVSNVMDTCSIVRVLPKDRLLSVLPIHHTFENTMGMMCVLYSGASTAFCEGLRYVAKNMTEAKPTILVAVPLLIETMYKKIWKQAEKAGKSKILKKAIAANRFFKTMGLNANKALFKSVYKPFGGRLRMLISGAAYIDPSVCRGFEDLGIRLMQGYGLTECSPLISGTPDYSNTYKKAGSVGPVVRSGELKILDQDENGIGEIVFKGPNVMLGYYNMPEETAEVLKEGWFHTGDLGFLDHEDWLYLTGRKKNVIVTKTGKNIYPEEVEVMLDESPFIQESMVYGISPEENESEDAIVSVQILPDYEAIEEAFGLKREDSAPIFSLIKKEVQKVNDKVPVYKRIRNIKIRSEDFIRTTTKKIKRDKNL
ncbi:MAG: AMP-dependent synthetase/ligase [Anaerovoracaceae bacterium]|jgi:long-chain acyl-CoA synthetase